jgi:hypothetical protein
MRVFVPMLILLIVASGVVCGQTKSKKRGLGYGYHSPQDMATLSKGISWWYNWYQEPDDAVKSLYKSYDVEYVPMIWGNSWNETALKNTLNSDPEIKFLLGFNEPNFLDQANMTPRQAAARWPEVEAVADAYGLALIGPAVNFCGNCVSEGGVAYSDPIKYLDDFFRECQDCRVDYIAVHWYGCGGLEWYLELFEKYNKPLWVTEIACWDNTAITLEQQKNFLINAVDYLESNPNVYRYAWFAGRADGPHVSLLGQNGKLTELGELYINMPVHDPGYYHPVPSRIQGQEYQRMQGIQLEATQDESGLMNVGYLNTGDWIEYNIEVAEAGEYSLSLRIAGIQTGKLEVVLNNELYAAVTVPATGGWQSWQTIDQLLSIPAGRHTLRFKVARDGFNLNWLEIGTLKPGTVTSVEEYSFLQYARLYPNPVKGEQINIELGQQISGQKLSAQIFNAAGRIIWEGKPSIRQNHLLEIGAGTALEAGFYLLKISNDKAVRNFKFIVL